MPVDSTHAEYDEWEGIWAKCRDVVAGEEAIKAGGETYLPKLSGQSDSDYGPYLDRAWLFNASARTVQGLAGLIFRRDPVVEVPPAVQPFLEDVTGDGQEFASFAMRCAWDVLTTGRIGLFADFSLPLQVDETGTRPSRATAELMGRRPTLSLYRADQIVNWALTRVGNLSKISLVVLYEEVSEFADEFEVVAVPQYRVLELDGAGIYRQRFFRKTEGESGDWVEIEESPIYPRVNGQVLDAIPFVFVNPSDLTTCVAKPPLLDLVNVNLAWYRNCADYEHGLLYSGNPTPYITGHQQPEGANYGVGSSTMLVIREKEAKLGFMEFTGQGLEPLAKAKEHKETLMAMLGARMLAPDPAGVESAEAARIHREGESSALATIANTVSMGLTQSLQHFGKWLSVEDPEAYNIQLNTDFLPAQMDPARITALVAGWQAQGLTKRDLFWNLQRGEVIPAEKTFEEWEEEFLESPPPMGAPTEEDAFSMDGEEEEPPPDEDEEEEEEQGGFN
jgi:hypothetical protein